MRKGTRPWGATSVYYECSIKTDSMLRTCGSVVLQTKRTGVGVVQGVVCGSSEESVCGSAWEFRACDPGARRAGQLLCRSRSRATPHTQGVPPYRCPRRRSRCTLFFVDTIKTYDLHFLPETRRRMTRFSFIATSSRFLLTTNLRHHLQVMQPCHCCNAHFIWMNRRHHLRYRRP